MGNKLKKKFTVGISYSKHLIKAKATFHKNVLPHFKPKCKITEKQVVVEQTLVLSPEQKAHLNCQSPI